MSQSLESRECIAPSRWAPDQRRERSKARSLCFAVIHNLLPRRRLLTIPSSKFPSLKHILHIRLKPHAPPIRPIAHPIPLAYPNNDGVGEARYDGALLLKRVNAVVSPERFTGSDRVNSTFEYKVRPEKLVKKNPTKDPAWTECWHLAVVDIPSRRQRKQQGRKTWIVVCGSTSEWLSLHYRRVMNVDVVSYAQPLSFNFAVRAPKRKGQRAKRLPG